MLHSAPVNFGSWHELVDAPRVAPEETGVLQARAHAPLAFPSGKSAMVLYASSGPTETLRGYVSATGAPRLARAAAAGADLIRFGVTPRPDAEVERLLRQFSARFGALPPANRDDSEDRSTDTSRNTPQSPRQSDKTADKPADKDADKNG
jgi:hypothetical protein